MATALALVFCSPAHANATYVYQGNFYNTFVGCISSYPPFCAPPYAPPNTNTQYRIQASFTLAQPLPPNFGGLLTPVSFTMTDGFQPSYGISMGLVYSLDTLYVTTDSNGNISGWSMRVGATPAGHSELDWMTTTGCQPYPSCGGFPADGGNTSIANPGGSVTGTGAGSIFNSPGTWSTVPPTDAQTSAGKNGDPVSTGTGELYDEFAPDLALGGPLVVEFRRYYGSFLTVSAPVTQMGYNWTHSFEWVMTVADTHAEVFCFGGQGIQFQQVGGTWQLVNPEQYGYQLVTGAGNTYLFMDPRSKLIYTFAGAGATLGLSSIQDRNGNTITISQPVNGYTQQASDGLGRTFSLNYDARTGNLLSVSDQTGRTVSFAYGSGNLTQLTDANGKIWNFAYTTSGGISGLMETTTMPRGNTPLSQTYDSSGRVSTQVDSRGNVTTFSYSPNSTTYTDPLGAMNTDTNNAQSDLIEHTDPDNQAISITYDNNQRRTSVTDRLGATITFTYHQPSGYVASETDAAGNTVSYTYTAQVSGGFTFYDRTQVQYPDGTATLFTHDANGNVTSVTDQAGKVWTLAYNPRGQITSITDPAGRVLSYAYNADATVASETDTAGNVTTYSYDAAKRVSQMTFADGTTRSFTYDNLDNILSTVDEKGNTTAFAFNTNGRFHSVTDALGNSGSVAYDNDEEISTATDRTGHTSSFTYDNNDLLSAITTPVGDTFNFQHDSHHRLSAVVDPLGDKFTFGYDKEDVPISVTDPLSRTISLSLDPLGYPLGIETPLGESYTLTRDQFERLTSSTDPTGVATVMTYDQRGLPSRLSVGGLTASYSRDASGIMISATDPNENTWLRNRDSAGRLESFVDPLNRPRTYTYDQRNRFRTQQTPLGTVTFSYDAAGNLTQRLYSDGTNLQYSYDKNDRVVSAPGLTLGYDAEARITASNGLTIGRDADGRMTSLAYAPGKTVNYSYNPAGSLASITDWIGGSTTFTYDAAQELVTITRPNGVATHLTYDADGRIASITEDIGSSIIVNRDAAGRIKSENRSQPQVPLPAPGLLPLSVDAADQVTAATYDAMGRVIAEGALYQTFTWDLASRVTSYSGSGVSENATYDGFGMRTSLSSQNATSDFVWNYATDLPSLAVVRSPAGDQRYYIYSPGGTPVYAVDAATNARHFYHFDESGSTVELTDDAGAVTDAYGITPFGETVTHTGATDNPFTWMGKFGVVQEGTTSLYYVRARYYDSVTAKFLSPDPIFIPSPQDINPYQYADNDPLNRTDPFGTQVFNSVLSPPSQGSPSDTLEAVSEGLGKVNEGLNGLADDLTKAAENKFKDAVDGNVNPGATAYTKAKSEYIKSKQFANNLKKAADVADAAGKGVDLVKDAIKLNEDIKAAQNEEETNSAATDIVEAQNIQYLWSLKKAGKLTGKEYVTQVRAIQEANRESKEAGLTVLVIDEWIAGLKFTQNSLTNLASSGVSKGKGAGKKIFEFLGKHAGDVAGWIGSKVFGQDPNAK